MAELARTVLKETGTGVTTVAGDGTVVQVAASCHHTIQLEAAQTAAREAREKAQAEPENAALTACTEHAEAVQATLEQRTAARRAQGKSAADLSIRPVEPEAVVQPQKNKKVLCSVLPAERTGQLSPCDRPRGPRPLPEGVAGPEPTRSSRQLGNR